MDKFIGHSNLKCIHSHPLCNKLVSSDVRTGTFFCPVLSLRECWCQWGQNPSPWNRKCLKQPVRQIHYELVKRISQQEQVSTIFACMGPLVLCRGTPTFCTLRNGTEWVTSPQGLHTYSLHTPSPKEYIDCLEHRGARCLLLYVTREYN